MLLSVLPILLALVLIVVVLCDMVAGNASRETENLVVIGHGDEFPEKPQNGELFCKNEEGTRRFYCYRDGEWLLIE